jgi:predicted DNA-binding transcriptional regulator YafY
MAKKITKEINGKKITTRKPGENQKEKAKGYTWRNFKMFSLLYTQGHVTVKQLMEELCMGERQVQRMMYPYKEDGVLIRDEFDQAKWNFNPSRHRWDKHSDLTSQDQAALAFLCKLSKVFGAQIGDELMTSVARQFLLEDQEYPYFMITARVKSPDVKLKFYDDLYAAIKDRNKIKLTYETRGADGKAAEKTVLAWPISFVLCDGMWYLSYLLEPEKGREREIRTLRYGNIRHVELLVETFVKPDWVKEALKEARNIWFNARRDIKVTLEIDNQIREYFDLSEYFPKQKIVATGPKTFRVETMICNEMEALPNIMRFMPYIKVVAPASLKKSVVEKVKQYLK